MSTEKLITAHKEILELIEIAKKGKKYDDYERIKTSFLGGIREGESWGLRKWFSKNCGGLSICNDLEAILEALQNLPKDVATTITLCNNISKMAKQAYDKLKLDVPDPYQAVSTAHPYLPIFHRLDSVLNVLKGLHELHHVKDDLIIIDDDSTQMTQNVLPKKRVLCLGMSYSDISLSEEKFIDEIIEKIDNKELSTMDGRDLARCKNIELMENREVYTVSLQNSVIYGNKHYTGNFSSTSFVKKIKKYWPNVQFEQIIFDYFHSPDSWTAEKWTSRLFSEVIPNLAKENMFDLECSSNNSAVIYLPFNIHCLKQVVAAFNEISCYYTTDFIYKEDMNQSLLCKATSLIDHRKMKKLGKNKKDQEKYLKVSKRDIMKTREEFNVDNNSVIEFLDKFKRIRDI